MGEWNLSRVNNMLGSCVPGAIQMLQSRYGGFLHARTLYPDQAECPKQSNARHEVRFEGVMIL